MRDVVVVDDRLLYGVSAGDGGPAEGPQPPPRVPAHQPHLGYREAENIILPDSMAIWDISDWQEKICWIEKSWQNTFLFLFHP